MESKRLAGLYSGSQRTIKKCPAVGRAEKRPLPGLKAAGEVKNAPYQQDGEVDKPDQARISLTSCQPCGLEALARVSAAVVPSVSIAMR